MDADGWEYYYDDASMYVARRHPNGGSGSICGMSWSLHSADRKKIGEAIADMLNKNPELMDSWRTK